MDINFISMGISELILVACIIGITLMRHRDGEKISTVEKVFFSVGLITIPALALLAFFTASEN